MHAASLCTDGASPDEPDATWNVTLDRVSYSDMATVLAPMPVFAIYYPNPGETSPAAMFLKRRLLFDMLTYHSLRTEKVFELNLEVSDLVIQDCIGTYAGTAYDSMYGPAYLTNQGVAQYSRSRWERNGCFADGVAGNGGTIY